MINIEELNKGLVLLTLWKNSREQGLSFLQRPESPITLDDTTMDYNNSKSKYFDYYYGRVMKVDLSKDSFDPYLYDRDNGNGAAERAISKIR